MSSVTVDDLRFRFVTTRPSLMLTATVGERWNRQIERLRSPADLSRWFVEAGLSQRRVTISTGALNDARELREAIYSGATARIAGRSTKAAVQRTINTAAAADPPVPRLLRDHTSWDQATCTASALLSAVARDAIDVLGGRSATRLRECASDTCGLLFLDESRPGRRRWCSSERCGGAARAAQYRSRRDG